MSAYLENQFISEISLQMKLVRHPNSSARVAIAWNALDEHTTRLRLTDSDDSNRDRRAKNACHVV